MSGDLCEKVVPPFYSREHPTIFFWHLAHLTIPWIPLSCWSWSLRILSLSVFPCIALIIFISVVSEKKLMGISCFCSCYWCML
jgi:hypothetical protein